MAAELRTSRKLARFWTAVVALSVFSLFGYLLSCLILVYTAPYSPSIGASTPLYLLGGIDPTFFLAFQLAAVLLLFDASQRQERNRIDEVLDSKPVTNFEYLAGRVLGISLLLWLVVVLNVLAMECVGLVSNAIGFRYAEPIQLHSILNLLLLDTPATLLFWSSFVVFLSATLRIRFVTVVLAIAAMFAWFFLVLNVPYSLLSVVSASSNDSLFVSDLVPEFPHWQTLVVRLSTLVGALALVASGALAMRRRDGASAKMVAAAASAALAVCAGSYTLSFWDNIRQFDAPQEWQEAHRSLAWNGSIDIQLMEGTVQIDPGRRLKIDLEITLSVDAAAAKHLVFTLNPGMTIDTVEIDKQSVSHTFDDGLLQIRTPTPLELDSQHTMRVVAHGIPNPRFAYFDSAVDFLTDAHVPGKSVRLFGKDGSVFEPNFVALMPGAYWYPVPGTVRGDFHATQNPSDFFVVDLFVHISSKKLQLVATGASSKTDDGYRISSSGPVHELALFAADYKKASIEVGDMVFSMYLHKRHTKNLNLLDGLGEELKSQIQAWLEPFTEYGLTFPHDEIALVEVPNRLRTVGGGWRMDTLSALPGVVLMKAQGFPRTQFNLALEFAGRQRSPEEVATWRVELLSQYFAMGLGSDNLWSTVAEQMWSHSTAASGQYAAALDQLVLKLLASPTKTPSGFFSVYSTFHVAHTTAVSPYTLMYGSDPEGWTPSEFETREEEIRYGVRPSLWRHMESNGLSGLPSSHGFRRDLELMLLKSSLIAIGLLSANDWEQIASWLSDFRHRFAGQNYTYDDLIVSAEEHNISIHPFLTDWLHETRLPAFVTSPVTVARISDDEQGNPRYQSSITVRNVGSVPGFIRVRYGGAGRTRGIHIEADSAKTVTVTTPSMWDSLFVMPHLSLNHLPFSVASSSGSVQEQPNAESAPVEQQSDWTPKEEGIVVDDLDPGFTVFQPSPDVRPSANIGPFDWFREHRLEVELEGGIPTWGQGQYSSPTTSDLWNRRPDSRAYGKFRRTTTWIWVRDPKSIHTARFEADIPEAALWRLEYHMPSPWYRRQDAPSYQLVVENGNETWDVELEGETQQMGWNALGEFNLQAGKAKVDVVGSSRRSTIFADAIRWTKN